LPLYEYKCKKCGRTMEKIRKFSDPPLTICENCGGELEQLLSSPAIQFKGSGWYITDYAKKSSPGSSSGESASSGEKSEKKEEKKASSPASEPAKTSTSKD
jgi:putative FmdB family regulatory protein